MSTTSEEAAPPVRASLGAFARPWTVLAICALATLIAGLGLAGVRKDPSVDAFVPENHPAALARDAAREVFGLEDPMIIGLVAADGASVFTPAALTALRDIARELADVEGVQADGLISVASENAISGRDGDLYVDPMLEDGPVTPATAALAWERLNAMPMLMGLLGSHEGDAVTLIAPVDDPNHAEEVYAEVRDIAERHAPEGVAAHVAGVAAMNARLADMVTRDTAILVPVTLITVVLILLAALRRPLALLGPAVLIAASVVIAVGLMGWTGARYYLISTALPVVVMSIAVADSVHVTTLYLRARAADPARDARAGVSWALRRTWLPVTMTSVTTAAGFVGLSLGAAMRPISEFGLFAAAGVVAAWAFSLTLLPALLIVTDLKPSARAQKARAETHRLDAIMRAIAGLAIRRPRVAASAAALALLAAAGFAVHAEFDYHRANYFIDGEAVREADATLNARLDGLNFLDVTVAAPEPGGLMTPGALAAIDALASRIAGLDHVRKVSGIHDYIALMHQALTGAPAGELPSAARAPAQYMFLYEASAPPDDFAEEIDYEHQHALIRAQLDTDGYLATRPVVDALEEMVAAFRAETGLEAAVSGRVAVNDGWMSALAANHFRGLALAAGLVFFAALAAFRAILPALLAMLPVFAGALFVYAAMGASGVDIAPATSMTAAICTGLGVDFGIHLIAHARRRLGAGGGLAEALNGEYAVVARACFYSAAAFCIGMAVLMLSSAPPLRWFGLLVGAGVAGALACALFLIPLFVPLLVAPRRPQHA